MIPIHDKWRAYMMKRVEAYVALNPSVICGMAKYSVNAMYGFRAFQGDIIHVAAALGPCVVDTYFSISASITNKDTVLLQVIDPEYSVTDGNRTVTTKVTDYVRTRFYAGSLPVILDLTVRFCMTLVCNRMLSFIDGHVSVQDASKYHAACGEPQLPVDNIPAEDIAVLGSQDDTFELKKKNESLAAQLACANSDVFKLKSQVHQKVQERLIVVAERDSLQRKLADAKEENEFLTRKVARTEQLRNFAVNGDPEAVRKFHDARREAETSRVVAECAQRTAEVYRLENEALRQQNKRLIDEMEALKGLSELGKRSRDAP